MGIQTDNFERYLQEKHAKQYMGLDDEMCDDFIEWMLSLDIDDWLYYGGDHASDEKIKTLEECKDLLRSK